MGRVALVDFRYTVCYFLFFSGWAMMDRSRLVALILFFLSFNTNSMLVLYAAPILDFLYRKGFASDWKGLFRFSFQHIDYVFLPFVYFFIKIYFFKPTGLYFGYNEGYELNNLLPAVTNQFSEFLFRFRVSCGIALLFSMFSFLVLRNKIFSSKVEFKHLSCVLFGIGVLTFILGAFPYWILGRVPSFIDWNTRHQLLLPLGTAVIIVAVWLHFKGSLGVFSVIVGLSLAYNASTYKDFFVDWQKQKQIIHLFSINPALKDARLIIINDQSTDLNAIGRTYRFYEWNGLLELAFGDQKRFGINKAELPNYLNGGYINEFFTARYKASDFNQDSGAPVTLVEINVVRPTEFGARLKKQLFPEFTIATSIVILPRPIPLNSSAR